MYPAQIIGRDMKKLRNREIPMVKVLWQGQTEEEATWEVEEEVKKKYSQLAGIL